jgi:pimeloyl-ACP methyl ester carboxylesterase
MGSHLDTIDRVSGDQDWVWLNYLRLVFGSIGRLRLELDETSGAASRYDVVPSGLLKDYYAPLSLSLARSWNLLEFPFDWRQDLDHAADALRRAVDARFGPSAPFHMVAHSMGGLVARTFAERFPERWASAWDAGASGRVPGTLGGRLIQLGTPNHGSYLVAQVLTGVARTVRLIARADTWHNLPDITRIIHTFPGIYEMLPSPLQDPAAEPLYDSRTYRRLDRRIILPQVFLDRARARHERLRTVHDPDRLVYVAGDAQTTVSGVRDLDLLDVPSRIHLAYDATTAGDGSVTHAQGLLPGVTTYYVSAAHENIPSTPSFLSALDELLLRGCTSRLASEASRRDPYRSSTELLRSQEGRTRADLLRIYELRGRVDPQCGPVLAGANELSGPEMPIDLGLEMLSLLMHHSPARPDRRPLGHPRFLRGVG